VIEPDESAEEENGDILVEPSLRGLGLRRMPCGILTRNRKRKRKHHNWIVVSWATGEREEYGEDYERATRRGLEIKAYLILELK
jgi:hypothetical protein